MAASGSATITHESHETVKYVTWAWTSDVSGADVSGGAGLTTFSVSGEVLRITTDPGSPAPSANYDVVINDQDGIDVAMGFLADRHTTTTESVVPRYRGTLPANGGAYSAPVFTAGPLELVITNAGTSKQGVVRLYYR